MRGLIVLLLGLGLLAPASGLLAGPAQLTADALGATGTGCVSAASSFTGQAYCLDGNHTAAFDVGNVPEVIVRREGMADLAGWQVPTRCDGNGTSGKRVQLVYVHITGSPSTYAADLPYITQRLVPGANGVLEHSSNGKRAIRWVTTKQAGGCVPAVLKVTLPKSVNIKGYPFDNIGRALQGANAQLRRTDRNYLVLVDTPDHPFGYPFSDCGLGEVRYDSSPGVGNRNNSGQGYAMVWSNCWTGLITAHELIHTLGAVQPTAPHKTDNGHCWDGKDDMCYADGSKQKQRLVCNKPNNFRLLDCKGDDYFSLSPKKGSYLASHWNSATSPFLIDSKPKPLPTAPGQPVSVLTTVVDATHLRVSWAPGVTTRGAVTSWTVAASPTNVSETASDGHGVSIDALATLKTVGAKARSVVLPVKPDVLIAFTVTATNASGDGPPSVTVKAGAGAAPSPIVATYQTDGFDSGGYVSWTGGASSADLLTCTAVLVNGQRIDANAPGETLANTTDPSGGCFIDSPGTYVQTLAPTDVLEVYARNLFGVTRVTVPHA